MKPKVYIETTIPSYLVTGPSQDLLTAANQQLTRDWWESRRSAFDLVISEFVLQEAAVGDPLLAKLRLELLAGIPVLEVTPEMHELAERLVVEGPLPKKAAADAAHIAVATVHECEYLLTWNCRHIANAELQRGIRRVMERFGYETPSLCTPTELMGGQD